MKYPQVVRIISIAVFSLLVAPKVNAQNDGAAVADTALEEIRVFTTKVVNSSGARYHKDGCRYLRLGQFQVDERVAIRRGLLPCSVCLPERIGQIEHLRPAQEVPQERKVFRRCAFRTRSGKKCERETEPNSRYCHLHQGREH